MAGAVDEIITTKTDTVAHGDAATDLAVARPGGPGHEAEIGAGKYQMSHKKIADGDYVPFHFSHLETFPCIMNAQVWVVSLKYLQTRHSLFVWKSFPITECQRPVLKL